MNDRTDGLLSWQWRLYPDNHCDRRNLLVHALTVPLFQSGTVLLATSPFTSPWMVLPGALAVVSALALQGRGHRLESEAPVPFRGPFDVVARLFVEQWVTFPRFVLSGGFARAWRATRNAGASVA
ncbi:terminase [Archangium lipolyticum]|uniref:terminase n=1 Tax=Archangium lipolyticum TaxID=2970465 RepID=UPI00214A46A4|nr:terminase [Archangium lipolyticum]